VSAVEDVCAECGAPNGLDEDFCGECGAYLEWDERRAAAAEPERAPAVEEPAASRGIVERVKAAVGVGQAEDDRAPEPATPTTQESVTPDAPAAEPASTAGEERPAGRADALVVRVPEQDGTGPRQPEAVQPGRPAARARRRPAARDREPLSPGDLVCGECGAGNRPDRKFCRRCGHDLAEAEVARVPWWRRLRRRRTPTAAGARPTTRRRVRFPTRLVVVLAVLAVVVGAGWLGRGLLVGAFDAVMDRVQGVQPFAADGVRASDAQRGHPAGNVVDNDPETYWAPAATGEGRGSSLTARFDEPLRVVYLVVTPGVSVKDPGAFRANGRPARLRVVLRGDDTRNVETVELRDEPGAAVHHVATSDVTSVRIQILRSHGRESARTAIAEIEFQGRR